MEEIRWLVARRAEALHRDPDEATTPPGRPSSTTDAVSISAPDIRVGSHWADKVWEHSFRPQRVAAPLVLGPAFGSGKVLADLLAAYRVGSAFGTGKVLADLVAAYRVGPALDTRKLLERTFDTGKVVRSFDAGNVLRQSFGTQRVAANLVSIDRVLERHFDFGKALERSFDTGKVLERSFATGNVLRSFDTSKVLGPAFGSGKVLAGLLSTHRVGSAFSTGKVLAGLLSTHRVGSAFGTGKVLADLLSTHRVGPALDTRKLLGPSFGSGKVLADLLSAYRVSPAFSAGLVRVGREPTSASPLMPTSPHGPTPAPADPGWLHQLLNDEERIRAAFPPLAVSSGTCMILGLLLVALVDPAVRAALDILSDEASIAAFIVAVMTLTICQHK